ncbi:MAG: hypothetical protein WBX11_17950 [Thiobacillaceae bacterium]
MESETDLQKAEKLFFLKPPKCFALEEIDEALISDEEIRSVFAVFKSTLIEVTRVIQVFYNMAMSATIDDELNRLFISTLLKTKAEFLRAKAADLDGVEIPDDEELRAEAGRRTVEEWQSTERGDELLQKASARLVSQWKSTPELIADTNSAALRQSSVMLWSACENLLREFFRILLNREPALATSLFKNDETKRLWNPRDFSLDLIEAVNFNVQHSMGNILLDINPMISLKAFKAGFSVLANGDEVLSKTLKSTEIHNLFALRNLIAHRNGFIDQQFLSESSFIGTAGEKIKLEPIHFEQAYMAAKSIGVAVHQHALRRQEPLTVKLPPAKPEAYWVSASKAPIKS